MSTVWRFIRPIDVLFFRGNRLFGGINTHGDALMPPWPSVFAGAIRSRMLVDAKVDLGLYASKPEEALKDAENQDVAKALGTPQEPGSFRIASLAIAAAGKNGKLIPLFPLPEDTVVFENKEGSVDVFRLKPTEWPDGVHTSAGTPMMLALASAMKGKPASGYWITAEGLAAWLSGGQLTEKYVVHERNVWKRDPRLGIAMDDATRTSAEGMLYTADAVAMNPGSGFLVGVEGAQDKDVPKEGLLRLGGDGRGAEISPWPQDPLPEADLPQEGERFTLYLETPGIFPGGWIPPGVNPETKRLSIDGLSARLAAAATARHHVISGWDLAAQTPKPAQRAVPAGAVYFFDEVEGNPLLYPERIWDLIAAELGSSFNTVWKQRRAEGFCVVRVGRWPKGA